MHTPILKVNKPSQLRALVTLLTVDTFMLLRTFLTGLRLVHLRLLLLPCMEDGAALCKNA